MYTSRFFGLGHCVNSGHSNGCIPEMKEHTYLQKGRASGCGTELHAALNVLFMLVLAFCYVKSLQFYNWHLAYVHALKKWNLHLVSKLTPVELESKLPSSNTARVCRGSCFQLRCRSWYCDRLGLFLANEDWMWCTLHTLSHLYHLRLEVWFATSACVGPAGVGPSV